MIPQDEFWTILVKDIDFLDNTSYTMASDQCRIGMVS